MGRLPEWQKPSRKKALGDWKVHTDLLPGEPWKVRSGGGVGKEKLTMNAPSSPSTPIEQHEGGRDY